ncbi:MAG: laccase domain-containing protein [Deltaproteobacteria bacterium]|nr:laccase domain-containing protein [Deltaproteobacteria bacterium]
MTTLPLLHLDGLFPPWIRWGFTTRHGGVSTGPYQSLNLGWDVGDDPERVRENHRLLAEALAYDPETLATVRQVHGHLVHVVRRAADGRTLRGKQGDAVVLSWGLGVGLAPSERSESRGDRGLAEQGSDAPGPGPETKYQEPRTKNAPPLAALVRTADCCPVLIASLDRPAAAVLHCGWRSTVRGLVAHTVACLAQELADPRPPLAAAIGPCIGPDAFEVGEEVAAAFGQKVSLDVVLRRPGRAKPHIDLQAAVRQLLIRAGVAPARIAVFPRCTVSEPDDFFSFRRDGHDAGRQAGVVSLVLSASLSASSASQR